MKTNGRKHWYQLIAEAILEQRTFDLRNDENGYPTVHWLIAHYLLRDASPFDRGRLLYGPEGYAAHVQRNFHDALAHLESRKYKVYRSKNGVRLQYVTLDKDYDGEAESEDFLRIEGNVRKTVCAALGEIAFKHPDRRPQFGDDTQNLLE